MDILGRAIRNFKLFRDISLYAEQFQPPIASSIEELPPHACSYNYTIKFINPRGSELRNAA